MSVANEIRRLINAKTNLKLAIKSKGVKVPDSAKIDTYGDLIEQIDIGVDTSDANAAPSNLEEGRTAYANNKKITGTLPKANTTTYILADNISFDDSGKLAYFDGELDSYWGNNKYIVEKGKEGSAEVPYSLIYKALKLTPDKIKSGTTVLDMNGTYTSDATATNDDIALGKTAYVNGVKVTGSSDKVVDSDDYSRLISIAKDIRGDNT